MSNSNNSIIELHSFSNASNQSFPLSSPNSLPPSPLPAHAATAADYDSITLDLDRLPIGQLLQSEWFHQNVSQTLNISMDNLNSLLHNAHQYIMTNGSNGSGGGDGGGAGAGAGAGAGGVGGGNSAARDPLWLLLTLTIFYTLIFAAGVLGNLITCIVIARIKFMHTATNFYLFNLAVSDLILLLSGMPQELYNTWYPEEYPFNNVLCKLEGIFSETAANATVLTITAFTVERYIAICHPFRQHTMSKLSRAIKFILAIWVTAFLLALPQAMQFSVVPQNSGLECTMENDFFAHVFAVSGFIFFGGPMTAICVLYVLIGVKLKRSRLLQSLPRRCYDVNRGISAQSRVIRMLVAVAVAFFFCWAPFHAQRLMAAYGSSADVTSALFNQVYHALNYISGVLYFLSTCINPLLYNIMSHKFREAFKLTLAQKFGLGDTAASQKHHRYSALLRQNGSMRLNTTDSIRTTITTTTINSANGSGINGGVVVGKNSRGSTQHSRCVSVGGSGKSTLAKSLSKGDVYVGPVVPPQPPPHNNAQHRILQTQLSQLSSLGDANSLMEADDLSHEYYPQTQPNSYRMKPLRRRSLITNAHVNGKADGLLNGSLNGTVHTGRAATDFAEAVHTTMNAQSQRYESAMSSGNETSASTKPSAPQLVATTLVTTQAVQPLNSVAVAELPVANAPTSSRLKLSRIISRRQRDVLLAQSPRVELIHRHLPGMGHHQSQRQAPHLLQAVYEKRTSDRAHYDLLQSFRTRFRRKRQKRKSAASTSALESLAKRFRWRTKEGSKAAKGDGAGGTAQQNSVKASSSSSSTTRTTHTPTTVLMRIVYPTAAVSAVTAATMNGDDCARIKGENDVLHIAAKVL